MRSQRTFDHDHYVEQPQPLIADFWAPWYAPCKPCKACKLTSPIFEQVARDFRGTVRCGGAA